MSDKYYVGLDTTSFADNGKYKPISRVTLLVDDENSLTAGDDTGMEITASCPHATQAMVNSLLAAMKGHRYQAYEAGAANIDPAAELGDGVTVCGVYSPLSKLSDDGRGYSDISSPGEMEMEDEYPSGGYISQEFNRKLAETRSSITKTAEEINLKIEGLDDQYTSLKVTLDGVTVSDASGTTKIKGSSIETSTLKVSSANITGTLTIGQLPDSVAETSDIPTMTSQLINNSGYQTRSGVVSIVNGTVTADYIYALGVEASTLRGNTIALKDDQDISIGGITLANTTSGFGMGITTIRGGIKLQSGGNIYMESSSGAFVQITDSIYLGGGKLKIGSGMYGDRLPSNPEYGQLFFLRG